MDYNEYGYYYISQNNKKLTVNRIIKRKSKTGYVSEKTLYTCENCSNCEYKSKCIKGHNCKTPLEERTKNLETSKLLTNNGKRIVQDITEYFDALFSGLIEKLGKQQSELLIELLNKVNIYFNEWYSKMN